MNINTGAHSSSKILDVMIPNRYESNDDVPIIDNILQNTAADAFSVSKSVGVRQNPTEVSHLSSTSPASTTRFNMFQKDNSTSSVYSSVVSGEGDSLNIALSADSYDACTGDHSPCVNQTSDPSSTTQYDNFNSKDFHESCDSSKAIPFESTFLSSIPGGIHIVSASSDMPPTPNVTPRYSNPHVHSTEKGLTALSISEGAPPSLKGLSLPAPPARDSPRNSSGMSFFRINSGSSTSSNSTSNLHNSNNSNSNNGSSGMRVNTSSSILNNAPPPLTCTPPPPEAPFHLMHNHFSSTMPIESITGLISSVLESISLGMLSRQRAATTPAPESTNGSSISRKFSIGEEDDRIQRMAFNHEESPPFALSSTGSVGRDLSAVPLRPAPCGGCGSGEFVYHYIEDQYLWKLVYSGSRSSDSCTCDIRVYLDTSDGSAVRAPATAPAGLSHHTTALSPVASQATQAYGASGSVFPTVPAATSDCSTVDGRQLNPDEKSRFRRFSPTSGTIASASAATTVTDAVPNKGSGTRKKVLSKIDTSPAPATDAGPIYIIEIHRLSGRCPMIPSLVQVLKSQLMGGAEAEAGALAPLSPKRDADKVPATPSTAAAEAPMPRPPAPPQPTSAEDGPIAGSDATDVLSPTSAITAAAAKVADTAPCYFHYLQLVRQMLAASTNAPTVALSPRPGLRRSGGGFDQHSAPHGDSIQPSAGSDWEVQLCGCDALLELVTSARRAVTRNATAKGNQFGSRNGTESGTGAGLGGKNAHGERLLSMVVDTGCVESLCRLLVGTFAQFTETDAGGAVAVNASNSALRNSFHERILGVGMNTLVQLSTARAAPSLSRANSGITVPIDHISQDLESEPDHTDTIRRRILVAVLEKEGVLGMLWDLLLLMHPTSRGSGSEGEHSTDESVRAAPTAEELSEALRLAPLRYRSATVLVNVYSSCAQGGSRGLIAGKAAEAARTYAPALADLCDEAVCASGASEPTLLLQPCKQLLALIAPASAV